MNQGGNNWRWGLALGLGVLSVGATARATPGPTLTRPVLVTPVVGSESIDAAVRAEVQAAVQRALDAEGYQLAEDQALIGQALIACQTPECIERALDAANAELAIVPALWERRGDEAEITLTLLQREGRNINADGVLRSNPDTVARELVAELLAARAALDGESAPPPPGRRPNAWLAGPVILIAGGTAAFIAIGVGAATRSDSQQLDTAAIAAWSAVGGAAIAGGITWWVVGAKRRRTKPEAIQRVPILALHPTGIDLRLRF